MRYPVGTRVRVVRSDSDPYQYEHIRNKYNGATGIITAVDDADDRLPYKVAIAGGEATWVSEVEPLSDGRDISLDREEITTYAEMYRLTPDQVQGLYYLLGRAGIDLN